MHFEERMETLTMLWDAWSGRPLLRWDGTRLCGGCHAGLVAFSPAGTYVSFTADDGSVEVFDLYRGLPVRTHLGQEDVAPQSGLRPMRGHGSASSLALSTDGQILCWGTWRGEVEIRSF